MVVRGAGGEWLAAPSDLKFEPANDVDVLLELRPFTRDKLNEVTPKLKALHAFGETPLYLAILQAIDKLAKYPEVKQRHVIAITDGLNVQTYRGDKKPEWIKEWIKNSDDVEKALAAHPDIRLDIVGFNLDMNTEKQEDLDEFHKLRSLVDKNHGKFYPASKAQELEQALKKSLSPGRYMVETLPDQHDSHRFTSAQLELNTPCEIEHVPAQLQVRLLDDESVKPVEVTLEGGEAEMLSILDDMGGRRLGHQRYDTNLSAPEQDPHDQYDREGKTWVGAHMPTWEGGAVRFYVSLQNAKPDQFSPRPTEAWIEITPEMPAGHADNGQKYVFYDLDFAPQRPVPVLSCLAPNWPAGAQRATVQLCWKFKKTKAQEHPLQSLQQPGFAWRDMAGVEFNVETQSPRQTGGPQRVILTEQHPRTCPPGDLYAAKIEMSPPPDVVMHSYNVAARRIRHVFDYAAASAGGVNYQVLLTTRKDLLDGACSLPQPLHVTLPPRPPTTSAESPQPPAP